MPPSPYKRTLEIGTWRINPELFLEKYLRLTDDLCWPWLGAQGPQGGLFGCVRNRRPQMTQARRVAYMIRSNQDCDAYEMTMTCHNKQCVNPHHMQLKPNKRLKNG